MVEQSKNETWDIKSLNTSPKTPTFIRELDCNLPEKQTYEQRIKGRREIKLGMNKSENNFCKNLNKEKTFSDNFNFNQLENSCNEKYSFWSDNTTRAGSFKVKGNPKHEVRNTSHSFPNRSIKSNINTNSTNLNSFFDDSSQGELVSPFLNVSFVAKKKKKKKFLYFGLK